MRDTVIRFRQIMPAPDWTVRMCVVFGTTISADSKPEFFEIPVIGWAVVGKEETSHPRKFDDIIQLLVWDEDFVSTLDDLRRHEKLSVTPILYEVFPPGRELGEPEKAQMFETLIESWRKKPAA